MIDKQTDRGIQFLRVIACFAVFICHFSQRMHIETVSNALHEVALLGMYGVELFFVISGYLACFSLDREKSIVKFYKKRVVRLLPLYYFCILYFFITETFIFKDVPVDSLHMGWLRYIFCLNGIVPSEGYFWSNLGITWTIPVFLMFYLLAPWIKKLAKSTLVSGLMVLLSFGTAYLAIKVFNGWCSFLIYLPCFLFGIFIYNAKKENLGFYAIFILLMFGLVSKYCNWRNYIPRVA